MKQVRRRRLSRIRAWFTPLNVVQLLAAVLIVACVVGELLQPVDPYHRAALATLQSALDELPPYPGSVAGKPEIKAGPIDLETILLINYGSYYACADVQTYYAMTVVRVGWQVRYPVRASQSGPPPHEVLDSNYLKHENGFTVELWLECFTDPTVGAGYTLSLQTPPYPAP